MRIDTLLRAKYDKKFYKLSDLIIVIRHRGLPNDIKEIDGSEIKEVYKDHFTLNDNTHIPSHRIIEIRKKK